ncbi:MAG: DMT family transporter [Methylocystaceae bacterium]|nr:DMT family transporter [Methylocystaceae bacterium]
MSRLRANFLLLITAFIWGTAFVAQHSGLEDVGPFTFTGVRFSLGTLVVMPLGLREYFRWKQSGGSITMKDWLGMGLCGVFLYTGSVSQQIGLLHTSVTNAGFFTGLYVPLVPLIMLVFWRKLPHWGIWPAALGCMVGTYYLSGGNFTTLNEGDFWVLGGSIFWALQVIVIGFVVKSTQTPVLVAAMQFLTCAVIGMTLAVHQETMTVSGIIGAGPELLYAGILSIGVAFTLQAVAQRHTPPADAAIIMSGEILFAALAGAIVLGERLNSAGYVGCVIMFICILSVELLPLLRSRKKLALESS